METGYDDCLEANVVGDDKTPRCPRMELPPLDFYANEANFVDTDYSGETDMTVTLLQKTKASPKSEAVVQAKVKTDLDIKVERLIDLKVQVDAMKSVLDEYEKLRKELATLSDTLGAANEQVSFEVENGSVAFSPKSFERKISDMPKVFDALGKENFMKLCKITMTDLDKYLAKSEQESCVVNNLTGARKISVVAKEKAVTQG